MKNTCQGCDFCQPMTDVHATALLQLMEDISQAHCCAGWQSELEKDLFRIAFCGDGPQYGFREIEAERIAELKRLAEVSDCWWVWNEDTGPCGPWNVCISLDDARARFGK